MHVKVAKNEWLRIFIKILFSEIILGGAISWRMVAQFELHSVEYEFWDLRKIKVVPEQVFFIVSYA